MNSATSIAVYAFSADPITYGHINIVERISRSFEKCIVGIGRNPLKSYLFSLDERRDLVERALAHLPNVIVKTFDGMVVDFAYEQGAKVIVKGVRNAVDVDYEQTLHLVGVSQALGIDTYILFADQALAHVSSGVVKAMQAEHGFIHDYVPPVVKAALEARISQQLIIGVTGDIASGKSTLVDKMLRASSAAGIEVHNIDLDLLAHQLMAGENISEHMYADIKRSLTDKLGDAILSGESLDRKKIAKLIFFNSDLREWLNDFLKKPMAILLRKKLKSLKGVILLNGSLLPDLNLLHLCNYRCILCYASEATQINRMEARGYPGEEIIARLAAQKNHSQKKQIIEDGIARVNFGILWSYDSEDDQQEIDLLKLIANCEESKWLTK